MDSYVIVRFAFKDEATKEERDEAFLYLERSGCLADLVKGVPALASASVVTADDVPELLNDLWQP